jgi:AraC family transcriptional regulator
LTSTVATSYRARFRKVLEHIDAQLDADLDVEQLSALAAFSKYHFHRQFTALFGISVYRYIQLSRLKRASYQLAFRSDHPVIDIALSSGYAGPEAFSRAFKQALGQSPSEFRQQPQWLAWDATFQRLKALRINYMSPNIGAFPVGIILFKETRVACFEHRGDPKFIGDSVRQFIAWRKQNHLPPRVSATFNIIYDDPETRPEHHRMDLCAATELEVAENPFGMVAKVIPAGRCAVLRHIGADEHLRSAVKYLYSEWLPRSGEELRDFPLFLQRVSFFPDVPEHAAVTDVFLPIQ